MIIFPRVLFLRPCDQNSKKLTSGALVESCIFQRSFFEYDDHSIQPARRGTILGNTLESTLSSDLSTPALILDRPIIQRNLERLDRYCRSRQLRLRPHTKTHKSLHFAALQMKHGASGLTAAKVGEAELMATISSDILLAYPAVDAARCQRIALLARKANVTVSIDSTVAADALSAAAALAGADIRILVELDVGLGRTGVASAVAAVELGRYISRLPSLRLAGLMLYPGQIITPPAEQTGPLGLVAEKLAAAMRLWRQNDLSLEIVSGGSTPTAYQSHLVPGMTEIRPGTYIFNDVNTLRSGCCKLEDCAATLICTVVSDAVPGQVVIDAGSKTLTNDRCWPDPDSGFGLVVEYPQARITKLSEEHGQVDVRGCERRPKVGERVTVIPNHICPCINLQDTVWLRKDPNTIEPLRVDARGMLI